MILRFPHRATVIGLALMTTSTSALASGALDPSELARDDVFLTQIGLIEGHLTVGAELYAQGAIGHATMHMKHPGDELYASLAPGLDMRAIEPFDHELTALATAVEQNKGDAAVQDAARRIAVVISEIRAQVGASAREQFLVVASLLRHAAEEYDIAVPNDRIEILHEYQDAWGFTQAAQRILGELADSYDAEVATAAENALSELKSLETLWPQIAGGEPGGRANLLWAAASNVELSIPRAWSTE